MSGNMDWYSDEVRVGQVAYEGRLSYFFTCIFTYEAGEELTVENARRFSRLHPRCGTSFLLIVVVVSILVFAFVGLHPLWWRLLSRMLLMPLGAGIAYEVLKFSSRHLESPWFRWLIVPGLLLQKLTTREPDDAQLEVALTALKAFWIQVRN